MSGKNGLKNSLGSRILKVNHAGENGAINIYAGQLLLCRLTAPELVTELKAFRSHEERHRDIFWAEMERRQTGRCRSYVLCGAGGYLLGVITALLGRDSIAATTIAVEKVVLRHLEEQLRLLRGLDAAAVTAIEAIVADERAHHDASLARAAQNGFWPRLLSPIVKSSTEVVIWLGMHL